MATFNKKMNRENLTTNFAGGEAFKQSKELELLSILLTSFASDNFYRDSDDTLKQLQKLISVVEPKFAAQAAIFARDKFGMRSISHVMAAELASIISGYQWAKNFYDKIIIRPDDMNEILSYYIDNKTDKVNPKFPNSIKKGFAQAFDKFDNYQLAKWKNENRQVKLIDIVNLVHPTPTQRNKQALEQLVIGELKSSGTWESMLSAAGQQAQSEEELSNLKSEAWGDLIKTGKIGYFALLRNLRNIIQSAPQYVSQACQLLVDENRIKSSRVLPFRFAKAWEEINKLETSFEVRQVLAAINNALEVSVVNVPKFEDTLFVVDVSGSMGGRVSDIASLFAAIFAKSNNCDVMTFSMSAKYVNYDPSDSVMNLRNLFHFAGGGTNFKSIFEKANKAYKHVIIASDMQGWVGHTSPKVEYKKWKNKFGCDPHVFSLDLAGLGTLQFPEKSVYALAGFSDKIFDIMSMLKEDRDSLIKEIKSIEI